MKTLIVPTLLACLAQLGAADLVCDGILGNSGGQGAELVRGGTAAARGLGPAVDRFGTLWDRAGKGVLVRCAADGRMLGSWRIPEQEHHYSDRLAIAGDHVVLLLRNELFTLPIDAAPGTAPTPLKQKADALAPTTRDGKALVGDAQGLAWLDPATGTRTPAGPGLKDLSDLDVGPDATIYAVANWQMHCIRDGRDLTDGWPKPGPGEKPQLIDGAWYAHGWHSTIKRLDADLAPDPGVVLGGNSGSFIGHMDESPDVINGRGLLHLGDGGWAVGCLYGGICLLDWDGARRQFNVVRRIGSLADVTALGVDGRGRVTLGHGWWSWDDTPDAPEREGPGTADGGLRQLAPIGGGRFVAPGFQYGSQPRLAAGQADAWRYTASQDQGLAIDKDTTGAAAVPTKDGFRLVVVTAAGKAITFDLNRDGHPRGKQQPVELTLTGPAPARWTSLAADPDGHLLAAADGQVIVLAAEGANWKELRRWRSWGDAPSDAFGKAIWIQADGAHLWTADHDRQRVLCFDLGSGKLIATFGSSDQAGTDLGHLDGPQMIAADGARCVVHDAGNQRLVKLLLR